VLATDQQLLAGLQEIRIRQGQPVLGYGAQGELWLCSQGFVASARSPIVADQLAVRHLLATISQSSLYALEEELRSGYVTIPGGHRVGLCGRAVLENGRVKSLKYITGFNLRLAKQVVGCAQPLLPRLLKTDGIPHSVLVVSPPQAGKTTLLRDLARSLSKGLFGLARGMKVVVVDERSELAACYQGVPTLDLGPRCDVLDACPKAEGMLMALRALSPEVLITDEIGRPEDAAAVMEALHSGVTVISSAHANNLAELELRPVFRQLLGSQSFGRYVLLSTRLGPGTIEAVLDREGGRSGVSVAT
jgi:stage III sporulation protein AA